MKVRESGVGIGKSHTCSFMVRTVSKVKTWTWTRIDEVVNLGTEGVGTGGQLDKGESERGLRVTGDGTDRDGEGVKGIGIGEQSLGREGTEDKGESQRGLRVTGDQACPPWLNGSAAAFH